jgi:hypothetical protein
MSAGVLTNSTAIGNGAIVSANNTMQLGNAGVTDIYAGVGSTATLRSGFAIIKRDLRIDDNDANIGDTANTLRFGASYTGEAIGSKRSLGGNHWGMDFYTNYVNRMSITNAGNVGVGLTAPARLFSVATDIAVDENNANNGTISNTLHFGAGNSGEAIGSKRTATGNLWGLDFYTNSLNRMSIANNGYVGIGNSAPAAQLDVTGTTTTDGLQIGNGTVITKMQSGSVTVGSSGSSSQTYTIFFPVAFATTIPRVFATARNEPASSFGDSFSVSIRAISATAVTLNIQRTDANTGWGQQLRVDWFAVE